MRILSDGGGAGGARSKGRTRIRKKISVSWGVINVFVGRVPVGVYCTFSGRGHVYVGGLYAGSDLYLAGGNHRRCLYHCNHLDGMAPLIDSCATNPSESPALRPTVSPSGDAVAVFLRVHDG